MVARRNESKWWPAAAARAGDHQQELGKVGAAELSENQWWRVVLRPSAPKSPQHKHRVRCEQLLLSFHFLIAKACYHPSFLDLQNSTQLLLDQAQDNKVVICKLNKQGHLWIFFKKENDVRSFLDIHIRQQIIYL
jgi:hypothetical protein